jgi:hypothetical protein
MSEKINIENSLYEFDIILLSDDGTKAVPLNKSSVRYLEVEDNLANIGIVGKIIISNYYGLLQKLNIYNVASESPNIFIRFKNLDFASAGAKVIPEVFVLAALGRSSEMSSNVIDRHVVFEFEEKSVVKLKRIKINSPGETITYANKPEVTISEIFKKYCPEITQKSEDIAASSAPTLPSSILQFGDSGYDIVKKSYDHLAYDPSYRELKSPGLVQIENVENKLERKLVVKSLAADITAFFGIVKSGGDASKYLNDKFTVAFSNKSNVLKDNIITKYDIMRVDYEEVFEKKWSNISKVAGNENASIIEYYRYSDLRAAFQELFTKPYYSNLPQRDDNNIKTLKYNYLGNVSESTTTAWATNKTLKSFIYDNIAVVFKVKGQPYRVPGKFIRINIDDPTGANKKASSTTKACASISSDETSEDADSLNGWWYVISVQHIFENDIYFNRITAVKIYLPKELPNVSFGLINDGGGAAGATGASGSTATGRGGGGGGNSSDKDGDGIPDSLDNDPGKYDNYDYIDKYPFSYEDWSKADGELLPPLGSLPPEQQQKGPGSSEWQEPKVDTPTEPPPFIGPPSPPPSITPPSSAERPQPLG